MKAVRVHGFGPPSVMHLEELPDAEPGPGEVVVEIRAAGVNPVDAYIRAGAYAKLPGLPYTPGSDGAGIVVSVGPDVVGLAKKDRVYFSGTVGPPATGAFAEFATCGAVQVRALPPGISFAQGAAVGVPFTAAYLALFEKARVLPGETVLIHGASGGVGTAAVQLARAAGLTVFGTAGTEEGRRLVSDQGAHHVLDHSQRGYLDAISRLTDGRGVDVIVEHRADVNLGRDLEVLADRGRVVVVGSRGTVEINPRAAMERDAAILGMTLFGATAADLARAHAALGAGLANATLRPVIGRELGLEEAALAHEAVLQPGAHGKIVLIP